MSKTLSELDRLEFRLEYILGKFDKYFIYDDYELVLGIGEYEAQAIVQWILKDVLNISNIPITRDIKDKSKHYILCTRFQNETCMKDNIFYPLRDLDTKCMFEIYNKYVKGGAKFERPIYDSELF